MILEVSAVKTQIDMRRLARGVALQALYEIDTTTHPETDVIRYHDASAFQDLDARILAYLVLRSHHEEGENARDEDDPVLRTPTEDQILALDAQKMSIKLVRGVLENAQQLDLMIHRYSPEWSIEQMAVIDRNILRIAIFEFGISLDTPIKVAINEAVELAKTFGSDTAPSFINGVLGSLADRYEELTHDLEEARKDE